MVEKRAEDVKDTALKLGEIRTNCPEDYFYLKGWIHCLLQKEGATEDSTFPAIMSCSIAVIVSSFAIFNAASLLSIAIRVCSFLCTQVLGVCETPEPA